MFEALEICGLPGMKGCLQSSQKVGLVDFRFQPGAACWRFRADDISDRCLVPVLDRLIRGGSLQVIDGHYPHVMPHSSNLSFWEKGMTSDLGHTWLIGVFCVAGLALVLEATLVSRIDTRGSCFLCSLACFCFASVHAGNASQFRIVLSCAWQASDSCCSRTVQITAFP